MSYLDEFVSADAHRISRRVFTAEEIYRQEKRHIFGQNWIYLSHESQIPNAGDYALAYIGETPIIVTRGLDNQIHASINSCTHRGLPVARADRGNTKRFICPYHGWSYDLQGNLGAAPQERKLGIKLDKDNLGLKKVPRVETYLGLIFGCINPLIEPLETYLGDMRWYLDCMFDRSGGGAEVVGTPHKWSINCNWKVPVENQLGDVAHGPHLHGALLKGSSQVDEIERLGFNIVPKDGHGVAVRLMPEDASLEDKIFAKDGLTLFDKETIAYMQEQHAEVEERLGKVRARLKPLCYSIYPNLSLLWGNSTLRVSQPRGAGKTEYWSWWVVGKDIPDSIKMKLQKNYTFFFGPGGILEQEDSEAWTQQYAGNNIDYVDDQYLYFGLGEGEQHKHPELPGMAGSVFNEHYVRAFYKRWKREIEDGMSMEKLDPQLIALKNLA
ncbi:MAG: Rieske 2Fe-2S domain-containing protein [Pseudomonadales bacterium]|nr:Rieske 2Fe-2S domain-containing protein [Pseudomonadales bacterium]